MARKLTRRLIIPFAAILTGLALVAAGAITVNLSFAKDLLDDLSREHLGLELHIDGPLRLRLGSVAILNAQAISLTSPTSPQHPLLQVRELQLSTRLLELWQGKIHLVAAAASGVNLDYCRPWPIGQTTAADPDNQLPKIAIDQLQLNELALTCDDPTQQLALLPETFSLSLSAPFDAPLEIKVQGHDHNAENAMVLTATGGQLNNLLTNPIVFPLRATLQAVAAELTIEGNLQEPLSSPVLNAALTIRADDMSNLLAALGQDSPDPGALQVESTLLVGGDSISATQGKFLGAGIALSGDLLLDLQAQCPQLTSALQAEQLDLKLLQQFIPGDTAIEGNLGRIHLETSSCGDTFEQHLASLHLVGGLSNTNIIYQGVELPIHLESALLDIDRRKPGSLSIAGQAWDEPIYAEATFGSLDELLSGAQWPLQLDVRAVEANLTLIADTAVHQGQLDLDGRMDLDLARFGALHHWFGTDPENSLAGTLTSGVSHGATGLSLSGLDAKLGQSHIAGNLSGVPGKKAPLFTVELHTGVINLDELNTLFPAPGATPDPAEQNRGTAAARTVTEQFEDWFALPDIDFDLQFARIKGAATEVRKLATRGHIRDRLIDSAALSLLYEGIDFNGLLTADLRTEPWTLAYRMDADNIDIGLVLARLDLAESVAARAEHLEFELTSNGRSIKQLLNNADFSCRLESLHWLRDSDKKKSDDLSFSYLELTGAPSSPMRWSGMGAYNEVDIRLLMHSPPLGELLDTDLDLPLQLTLASGRDVATIATVIDRHSKSRRNVQFDISGQQTEGEDFSLEDLQTPLSAYQVRGRVSVSAEDLHLTNLVMHRGRTVINGQVDILRQNSGYKFGIQLHSPITETEDFVEVLALNRTTAQRGAQTDKPGKAAAQEGFLTIVNRDIARLTEQDAFDIHLTIDQLYAGGNLLGKAELGLTAQNGSLALNPVKLAGPGGQIDAEFSGGPVAGGVEARLALDIQQLEYNGLLRLLDSKSKDSGIIFLESTLSSSAPAWNQIASGIDGSLDMALFTQDIDAGFLDLWASNLVLALLPAPKDSGKRMNCMVGRFDVEQGVMTSTNTLLDSTDVIIRARGNIDLGEQQLDLLIVPQAKREKFFSASAPLKVSGPFEDFTVEVASGELVVTLMRWYISLVYVPWKWITGERFPADGIATCYGAFELEGPTQ